MQTTAQIAEQLNDMRGQADVTLAAAKALLAGLSVKQLHEVKQALGSDLLVRGRKADVLDDVAQYAVGAFVRSQVFANVLRVQFWS